MQLILNIVLAMIGLMIIVFAIWSVIACIAFDRDPEKEYQEFKKRLDKMNEADRIAELGRIHLVYFLRSVDQMVTRYVTPNWNELRRQRDQMQKFFLRYTEEARKN